LAKQSGLQCERGILVNDTLQTFTPNIYAVGECVQHRNTTCGLVAPLFEQAKVCANHLAAMGIAMYMTKPMATQLKVTGIDLFSAGDFKGDEASEVLVYKDPARYIYKKLVIKNEQLVGLVLYGDTYDGQWYFSLINSGQAVSELRETLVFGQQYCQQERVA
jgi:nitrite reductase (NADH) large subunit